MGFIQTESIQEDDDFILSFSDTSEEEQEPTISDEEFIDDDSIEEDREDASFIRWVDNREKKFFFSNQTKNPIQLINREHVIILVIITNLNFLIHLIESR